MALENSLFTGRSSVSSRCGEGEGDEGGTLLEVTIFGIIILIIVIVITLNTTITLFAVQDGHRAISWKD